MLSGPEEQVRKGQYPEAQRPVVSQMPDVLRSFPQRPGHTPSVEKAQQGRAPPPQLPATPPSLLNIIQDHLFT